MSDRRKTPTRTVFGKVAATVIRESVTPPYRDRVDPLVKILLGYAGSDDEPRNEIRAFADGEPAAKQAPPACPPAT